MTADTLKTTRVLELYQDFLSGKLMCEVLDRIENCGIDKGKAEGRIKGRTQVMALMKKLFEQNRIDDAKKASEDAAYYDRLLKELGIN